MNLWTMLSIYTSLPHYKDCREEFCSGPCPVHDVFGYNGIDSYGPVIALPELKKVARLRGVDKLYPLHRELSWILANMREYGIKIDVPYVKTMRDEFEHDKAQMAASFPFNPGSQKQVLEYFREKHDIILANNQEATIREMVEELGDEAPEDLLNLQDYKEIGNGPDRWFQPYYLDKNGDLRGYLDEFGFVHPHLGFFTSSGRLMCSSPNFQNVAKRRISRKVCECGHQIGEHSVESSCAIIGCACKQFKGESVGKKVRRAIIAPEGYYIARADYSNAENRVFLALAGITPPAGVDLHNWMVDNIGIKPTDEFAIRMGSPRDASKSVTHAADYGEGIQLKTAGQLRTPKVRHEIEIGARLVFPEWKFRDKIVTFTGINLARRAFGDASEAHRVRANEIVTRYIDKTFPALRKLQQKITRQVEQEGAVRPPHGYVTLVYGSDEDKIKKALAIWGSQPVAHVSKLALVRLWRRFEQTGEQRPVLQVHDEILTYTKNEVDPKQAVADLRNDMEIETPEMPGFKIPADGSYGENWRDQKKVK